MTVAENDLLWIDLETTGLDANEEFPLELGLAITDQWGQMKAKKKWLIDDRTPAFDSAVEAAKNNEVVGPMHEKSGLWRALDRQGPPHTHGWTIFTVDDNAVSWLVSNGVPPGKLPLCGSSVGSLDRPFMLIHFPKLNAFNSYRNIDVSSFKETCRRVNPELFDRLRPVVDAKDDAKHRVLEDLEASITEYQAYLDNFLFTSLGD
jgi:oligoribonuclease